MKDIKLILVICVFSLLKSFGHGCDELRSCTPTVSGVSPEDQENIVSYHNYFRQRIALGEEGDYPQASNMVEFSWDDELENIAQRWANGCYYKHSSDSCKKNSRGWEWVGENLYKRFGNSKITKPNWIKPIKAWYDEHPDYPVEELDRFNEQAGGGKKVGHFTQMIWAETNRVGCGYSAFTDRGNRRMPYVQYYVCNYGPGGNIVEYPIYKTGRPCSDCPDNKCGRLFGLCASQTELDLED